ATRDMYIKPDGKLDNEASVIGYKSVAVPGTVAGLELALKTYGTMKLADVMAPAIQLAENGYPVSAKLTKEFKEERKDLQKFSASSRIFLKNGEMFKPGETLLQPQLAATLKRIAKNGSAEFYRGETARMLVQDMAALGGLISACYAKEIAATIDPRRASSSTTVHAGEPHVCGEEARSAAPQEISLNDGPHTTHFSVVDTAGNAVASTTTLNNGYGSHVTSSAGFLLNDEMDDFTTQPGVPNALFGLIQSEANAIAPGHRPLSSMTPTILVRDGKLSFVTGSPGGPTIISAVMLTVINWMRLGMDAQTA